MRRWAGGALLAPALAVALGACGSSPSASTKHLTPRQTVLASVTATEEADSASIGISVSVSGTPSLGGLSSSASSTVGSAISLTVSGHGLYSFADKTGQITLSIPSFGSSPGTTIQVREIGSDLYISAPQLSGIDGGKPWVEIDISQLQQQQGQGVSGLSALSDANPSQILALIKQLGGTVTAAGTADIDGTPTTEYQGQIDLAKSTTGAGFVSPQMAQALGLTDIPVDVWVDAAGRARQVETSFTVIGLTVSAQVNLGSFGTPVSVSAPPADQTADGTSLLQGGKLGNLL